MYTTVYLLVIIEVGSGQAKSACCHVWVRRDQTELVHAPSPQRQSAQQATSFCIPEQHSHTSSATIIAAVTATIPIAAPAVAVTVDDLLAAAAAAM